MKKIAKIISITIGSILLVFIILVVYLSMIRVVDLAKQRGHMQQLETYYLENDLHFDDAFFTDFDVFDPSLRLNEIQYLATHNSYKKMGSSIGKFFVGLGDSFDEAKALRYEYHTFTKQLELGIRSFELDLRYRNNQFELTHVPLVDNASVAVDFLMALEEIALFQKHHPNHLPLLILLEIKSDWMMLDPFLQSFDASVFAKLDSMLSDVFQDGLFAPRDMLEDGKTLKETVQTSGWPKLNELLGKVVFIIHPHNTYVPMYYEMDETLQSQNMFLGVYQQQIEEDYASFIVHNDPNPEVIQPLINQNFIVRTRLDANLRIFTNDWESGIGSGAQILSSDFSIGRKDLHPEQVRYLDDLYIMIKNRYLFS